MRGRILVAAAAALVGLAVGVTVNATLAQPEAASPEAAYELKNVLVSSFVDTPIEGTIVATPAPASKARVQVSLHGLTPASSYIVVGSARRCNRAAGPNQAVVWKTEFMTGPLADDAFASVVIARPRPLSDVRSVRVYHTPLLSAPVQDACGVAQVGLNVVGA